MSATDTQTARRAADAADPQMNPRNRFLLVTLGPILAALGEAVARRPEARQA